MHRIMECKSVNITVYIKRSYMSHLDIISVVVMHT